MCVNPGGLSECCVIKPRSCNTCGYVLLQQSCWWLRTTKKLGNKIDFRLRIDTGWIVHTAAPQEYLRVYRLGESRGTFWGSLFPATAHVILLQPHRPNFQRNVGATTGTNSHRCRLKHWKIRRKYMSQCFIAVPWKNEVLHKNQRWTYL